MSARSLTQAELIGEARAAFGDDAMHWAFRCPHCSDIATMQDFIDAGAHAGWVGQECIGRHLGVTPTNEPARGCNWTAYGLIHGPWTVTVPASGDSPEHVVYSFPLAIGGVS